jgi:hypothetical protein
MTGAGAPQTAIRNPDMLLMWCALQRQGDKPTGATARLVEFLEEIVLTPAMDYGKTNPDKQLSLPF